ncbi:MAG TPA: hypothetical protein PLR88_03180, partial [Bacteroidales bacterium]|nr:hypothetical protein [Bacteroidales bacterium]
MENSTMRKHVKVVGAIHIGFGVIGMAIGIIGFFALNFARGFVENEELPDLVLKIVSFIPLFIALIASLDLIGGVGLLYFQSWARYVVIVVAALGCLNIPLGTLKGVYSLWVLLQDETIRLFE